MNKEEKNISFQQEEITKILARYRLTFECPHCHGEITEEHFNKGERIFQLVNEKLRVMVGNEIDSQKTLYKQQ